MRENHAVGVAGAAGRVLDQRNRVRAGGEGLLDGSRARQCFDRLHKSQILGQPQHQLADVADFGSDDENARASIPQNAGFVDDP